MGFFSDLKEDLSQAVNELMPEENLNQGDCRRDSRSNRLRIRRKRYRKRCQTEQPTDAYKG